jgi:RNA polymerase-interacting CarD/CdnL/TRCF family regulator
MGKKKNNGEIMVYGKYGLVIPEGEEVRELDGTPVKFFKFVKAKERTVIYIPAYSFEHSQIRKPVSKKVANEMLKIMFKKKRIVKQDGKKWIKRYKELTERVKNADPIQLAEIFSELVAYNKVKPLSFGERSIFDSIKDILCEEIAYVLNKNEEELRLQLEKLLEV